MKNYRKLAPFVMVIMFALGVYMICSKNIESDSQYNSYITNARKEAEDGIFVYAMKYYNEALKMRPSLELYLEIGDFYKKMGDVPRAYRWREDILSVYPKESASYEYAMQMCIEMKDYVGCFKHYDMAVSRQVVSSKITELIKSIAYEYAINGRYLYLEEFCSGYLVYHTDGKRGYLNAKGNQLTKADYLYAGPYYSQKAGVVNLKGEAYYMDEGRNKIHNVATDFAVTKLGFFENNVYSAYDGEVWSIYHSENGLVCGDFTDVSYIYGGMFAGQKDGSWGIYNTNGEKIIDATFEDVLRDGRNVAYQNARFMVKRDGQYIIIDSTGMQHGTESYEDAKAFAGGGYAAVKKDGMWGFVDTEGVWFIEPTYEDAKSFSSGFAGVCKDGLWGVVNTKKALCIDYTFDDINCFNSNGMVPVMVDDVWSVLSLYQMNH